MSKFQTIGAKKIHDPTQLVFTLDHDIQNKDESNLHKYEAIEGFGKYHGVDFYPAGSGIGHQIMVERGYVVPGSFVVAADSHSNMYGRWERLVRLLSRLTLPRCGRREISGGRFRDRSRLCWKAGFRQAQPGKTSSSRCADSTTTTRF